MLIALAYPPGGKQHALLARSAHADSLTGHRRRPLARARARDLPRDGMALRRGHDPREVIGPAPRFRRNRLRFLPPRSLSSAALFFPDLPSRRDALRMLRRRSYAPIDSRFRSAAAPRRAALRRRR